MAEPTLRMMQSKAAMIKVKLQSITSRLPNMTYAHMEALDDELAKIEERFLPAKPVPPGRRKVNMSVKKSKKPRLSKELVSPRQLFLYVLDEHADDLPGIKTFDEVKNLLMEEIGMEPVDHVEFLRELEDRLNSKVPDGSAVIQYDRMRTVELLFNEVVASGVFGGRDLVPLTYSNIPEDW